MSAIPYASSRPSPSPSRSGPGTNKGAFPPRPQSVRVWAVITPEENTSQPGPAQSDTSGHERKVYSSPAALVVFGLLAALLAAVLAGSLAFVLRIYLGK